MEGYREGSMINILNFSALTGVGSKFIENVSNYFVNDSATVLLTVLVAHVGMLFENAHA